MTKNEYAQYFGYCSNNNYDKVLEELKQKLNELEVPLTPKQEFEYKYNDYKENWRKLIQ